LLTKLTTKKLEWGNKDHIESIKELSDRVFNVIISSNATYVAEAILSLLNEIMIYFIIKKKPRFSLYKIKKNHVIIVCTYKQL